MTEYPNYGYIQAVDTSGSSGWRYIEAHETREPFRMSSSVSHGCINAQFEPLNSSIEQCERTEEQSYASIQPSSTLRHVLK